MPRSPLPTESPKECVEEKRRGRRMTNATPYHGGPRSASRRRNSPWGPLWSSDTPILIASIPTHPLNTKREPYRQSSLDIDRVMYLKLSPLIRHWLVCPP